MVRILEYQDVKYMHQGCSEQSEKYKSEEHKKGKQEDSQ